MIELAWAKRLRLAILPVLGGAALLPGSSAATTQTLGQHPAPDSMEAALGLRERFRGLVERDRIRPRWIDGSRAWYVLPSPTGSGLDLILVDARSDRPKRVLKSAEQQRLFHAAVAEVEAIDATERHAVLRIYLSNSTQWLLNVRNGTAERIHDTLGYDIKLRRQREESGGAPAPRSKKDRSPFKGTLSPDGRYHAFVRDSKLWVETIYRGSRFAPAVEIRGSNTPGATVQEPLQWSPDGRFLICLLTEPAEDHTVTLIDSSPDDGLHPEALELHGYLKPGDRIERPQPQLFRTTDDSLEPLVHVPIQGQALFETPWSLTKMRWDRDSQRFTFLYNERGHRVIRWIGVEAATGKATAIIHEEPPTFFDYANKLYHYERRSSDEVLWTSERSGWNHLYGVHSRTGEARAITAGDWLVRSVESVDDRAGTAVLRVMGRRPSEDPYHVHFVRVNLATGALVELTQGDGTHELQWSPDGRWYIDSWSRVDQPPVWELRRGHDGALITTVETADASALLAAGWRPPERFVAKARDGVTDIHGIVYRPTHWSPDKTYPVIESIYAWPHASHVPKRWSVHGKPRELAELGFIVVQIDGMGTNWRSKAFQDVAWKNLGDAGFPDRIAWIQKLAAKDPTVDLERVGIYGGSAGGQNAMRALIAHHDFYRVAVADCGCHDNRMDKIWWNELWMSWPVGPHYDDSSNVVHAHEMEGDLMLVVGELDRNVDPSSTMQVVDALVKADKDFELLLIPGAGHGAAETPYGTRRRRDFFRRKLLGQR